MYTIIATNTETNKSLFVSGFKNSMWGRVPSFTGDKKKALKYKALALAESDKNRLIFGPLLLQQKYKVYNP